MNIFDWIPALSTTSLLAIVMWLSRKLITTRLTKAVKHEYDTKIETLRTSLRQNEELFKAELRANESQIDALRSGALSGVVSRQAALHARKIKAVEQVWDAVISLAPAKNVCAWMAVVSFENAAKEAAKNEGFRQIFDVIGKSYNTENLQTIEASKARPFISPVAWALYLAYSTIAIHSVVKLKMLQTGLAMPDLFDAEKITKLVKLALPHQAEYVEKYGPGGFHYLLEELESLLLVELDNILQGTMSDQMSIEQAAKIIEETEKLRVTDKAFQNSSG